MVELQARDMEVQIPVRIRIFLMKSEIYLSIIMNSLSLSYYSSARTVTIYKNLQQSRHNPSNLFPFGL